MSESPPNVRISWQAVASFLIVLIWYAGWAMTLLYALLTYDMQGWNALPYIVWGLWGLPVLILALILGGWSVVRIRKRPHQLKGQSLAWISVVCCLLAGPIWYGTQFAVVLIRQFK